MTKQPDNMRVWDRVCKTDPAHTKEVKFGRKFTTIDAQYQVQRATEIFGPVGQGWAYSVKYDYISQAGFVLAIADVTVSYYDGETPCQYGPVRATNILIKPGKGDPLTAFVDEDAYKKAMTDALTKALSHLGFSADVFLGQYDDNRYVNQLKQEFAEAKKIKSAPAGKVPAGSEPGESGGPAVDSAKEDDAEDFLKKIAEAKATRHLENLYSKYRSFIEIHARKDDFIAAFKARKAELLNVERENVDGLLEEAV